MRDYLLIRVLLLMLRKFVPLCARNPALFQKFQTVLLPPTTLQNAFCVFQTKYRHRSHFDICYWWWGHLSQYQLQYLPINKGWYLLEKTLHFRREKNVATYYFFLTMKAVTPTHKTGLMTGPLPTTAGEAGTDNDKGQLGIGF